MLGLVLVQCLWASQAQPELCERKPTCAGKEDGPRQVDDSIPESEILRSGRTHNRQCSSSGLAGRSPQPPPPPSSSDAQSGSGLRPSGTSAGSKPCTDHGNTTTTHHASSRNSEQPHQHGEVSHRPQGSTYGGIEDPDEWLVISFRAESRYPSRTDHGGLLVMSVYAVPRSTNATSSQPWARLMPRDSSVSQVIVPHKHGRLRNIRLRSSCRQCVQRTPLDSTWPIEPSWVYGTMMFESPVALANGSQSLELDVDAQRVLSTDFRRTESGQTKWGHMCTRDLYVTTGGGKSIDE